MIDLYGMGSPNVVKVMIMLEEIGAPFQMKLIDVFQQQQFEPEFSRLSPTNKVPVLVDPDGPGGEPITVFESGAILLYLAEKSGRFLPKDPRARASVFEWLMVQVSLQGPMGGQAVHFALFAPPGNEYAQERYNSQCAAVHKLLDKRLGEVPHLAGDEPSIADIAVYPWIQQAISFFPWLRDEDGGKLRALYPHLARWYETLGKRPGFSRAMALRAEISRANSMSRATPAAVDRFTLRGEYSVIPPEGRGVPVGYVR